ncbi:hypothetical protein, partial [Sphingobacterium sp. NPDC055431]
RTCTPMPSAIDMSVKFRDPSFVRTTARGGEGKGPERQCHPKLIMSIKIQELSFLILTPEKFIFFTTYCPRRAEFF